ncbi:MAG: epoxyqueuosine reductase QueH [Candidatus Thermoplasmatota archaeon]|nr:epoxyqueuosine reductase QueH [Candidatus Thermoplasmatota archaeon]
MKILVHVCCAPCFCYPHKKLCEEGYDVVGFWYNPNIHPFMEYRAREESLRNYAEIENVEVVYNTYDFIDYLKMQLQSVERPERCEHCYAYRLERTAKYATENGFDAFTTTLLVSHHQYHEAIKKAGNELAEKYGIPFYYEDFRKGLHQGNAISKAYGLYRQKYCGCILSEWERYRKAL